MPMNRRLVGIAGAATLSVLLTGCAKEPQVSYSRDVQPIVQSNCASCHTGSGAGLKKSGLDMSSYEGLMKGTRFGPVIEPGDSVSSTLVVLVEGKADPSINMPHGGGQPLSAADVAKLKSWIDQGAKNN